MVRFRIRAATPSDGPDLLRVAKHLDTVNLPHDESSLRDIVTLSERSFSTAEEPRKSEYLFVLEDLQERRVVGTSMILGQLGRRDAPYIYFDVRAEEKYSSTLDRHFHHTVLRIGYSYDGPTEIGGIVLLPEYRTGRHDKNEATLAHPVTVEGSGIAAERLGQFLSYVRFVFIAIHRARFRREVLAELLPPLEPDGTSHLWEALGRKFTGLDYATADRLSKRNKEFIKGLFPEGDIYASLLPPDAQQVIGQVGPQTKGVERLLQRIGLRYCDRIDPFDGGPHFRAIIDEIPLVSAVRTAQISASSDALLLPTGASPSTDEPPARAIVGRVHPGAPWWTSVLTPCRLIGGRAEVGLDVLAALEVSPGDEVFVLPLSAARKQPFALH